MCNARNALESGELFGFHRMDRQLESNVQQVIAKIVIVMRTGSHDPLLRLTKTVFSW